MSSLSTIVTRKTRSTSSLEEFNLLDELHENLSSSIEFINIYNQCYEITTLRSSLIDTLCNILLNTNNIDLKILLFILDSLIINHSNLTENQFKQNLLPFIKHILSKNEDDDNNNELLLSSILRFLIVFIEYHSNLLSSLLTEWLSIILNFIVTHITISSYFIYGDLIIDLLTKIVQYFTPLPKEIVDILGRSPSSIISTQFLTKLKTWVKNIDDTKLALFAIHLWEPLAALLSRLLTRGHTKGNEMLAVIQDAFVVANYSIRGAAFSAWASFMSHIYRSDYNLNHDDIHQQQLSNRLLKLFLTPFLSDSTSKSKSASIAKCRAWLILVSNYPTHINDVILPFFSFAFGYQTSCKIISTWWIECRKIGSQGLHNLLIDNINGELIIKNAGEQILTYLFDSINDELLETSIDEEKSFCLTNWNAYLTHLIHLFTSNNLINDEQRIAINTCLLTRIEQLWIDSRISTNILLKLFNTFEQTNFPLAIETVLRDTSIRTKTLSASQNNRSQDKSSDQSSSSRTTTLSDQYLHMLLEHSIRFSNSNDQTIEDSYLHVLSYLIDTLSKTSDNNFCYQTSLLLLKCSYELSLQPLTIPSLFWHIWFRCSTYLINILNRTQSVELNNQRQEITIELLLRSFEFGDSQRLDYSYTLLWIQLFKALCRLVILDDKHLIYLYNELFQHGLVFEQAIHIEQNSRLFGFLLTIIKYLLKNFIELDLLTIPKRSSSLITFCYTQLSNIINKILQHIIISNDDNNQNQWLSICYCLIKTNNNKIPSKLYVFNYIRDLIIDLFSICKTCSQLEIILTNLKEILLFLNIYEQLINSLSDSLTNKQSDNLILNKIIITIQTLFDSTNSSSLLQLISPLLIVAFQHNKTIIRNKMRKCWNETFGRLTFLIYPNELKLCLRDLKDKEHLLLPCFLADYDNSNILLQNSTDESQLSQQVDIVTPLINLPRSSPSPSLSINRSNNEKNDSIFVPITNNINYDNELDSPVIINKRISSTSTCLTEKQKEKLRTRHVIPLLCDDNSNTQSLSYSMDTPTIESMMANYQLRSSSAGNKQTTNGNSISLFKQSTTDVSSGVQQGESSPSSPPPPPPSSSSSSSSSSTTVENETPSEQILSNNNNNNEDDIPEESSISKKLRRSRRPSTSARKSLINNTRKKRPIPSSDETTTTTTVPSIIVESPASTIEIVKSRPLKSILKRLSPTKPRQDHHTRHVAFHDQVKVLLFASPSRRNINSQLPKKKSPIRDETKPLSTIITRRSSAIHTEQSNDTKTSSSKLLNLSELSLNSNDTEPIFPSLIDCDKPLDSLIHVVYGGVCPTNAINYFRSIKMNTVGDIARSTASQIEVYPIPPPKLANIQKALSLYQERLVTSPSLSPIIGESITPIASTSEEPIAISDGTFTKEGSSLPSIINDQQNSLYDVDTLIDSLDYERLYLNDDESVPPSSTNQIDFIRTRRQIALANRDEQISPQKRRLSSTNLDDDENLDNSEKISPKKSSIIQLTLGERLQKAADIYQTTGRLPFDNDYIELVRQLFNNSSLTHLEQLHLKSLFLD